MDKEINDLILELHEDVVRIMDNKGTKEIKKVYEEEVDYAYSEYEPRSYIRRYVNGGFADERSLDTEVDIKNNGVEFTLVNEAEAVNSNMRLDTIIEEGIYDWTSNVPKRPVYERTQERLEGEQVVENILESELKKLGYEFK